MKRVIILLLGLLIAAPAFAQPAPPPPRYQAYTLDPASATNVVTGTGYFNGDTVTLSCPGNWTTNPVVAWGSAPVVLQSGATFGIPPFGTVRCAQGSTSGSGTGFQVQYSLLPVAGILSVGTLASNNGSLIITNWEGLTPTNIGSESTIYGDKAGTNFTGGGAFWENAYGHNACGQGGHGFSGAGAPSNNCFGTDAGRNITQQPPANTFFGNFTGRNIAGATGSTPIGYNTGVGQWGWAWTNNSTARFTGAWNIGVGDWFGYNITSGSGNFIVGPEGTLTTGNENIVINAYVPASNPTLASPPTMPSCQPASSSESNTLRIGLGAACVLVGSGAAAPSTFQFMDSGSFQIGSTTAATLANGEFAMVKNALAGTAPGAGFLKLAVAAGTNAGSCKLVAYAGTSTTPVTVIDNVGGGC